MSDALPFDTALLDKLAEAVVRTGLNVSEGQNVFLTGSAEALPLIRRVAREAYKAGAGIVVPVLSDEDLTRARMELARDEALDAAPAWLYQGVAQAFEDNWARCHIAADNPMALADQDPARVARAARANSKAYKPAMAKIANFEINWSIAAYPGRAWAEQVFPDLDADAAQAALAQAIFKASRVDVEDPVAAWAEHNVELARRRDWLNAQRFDALHFRSEGTDLTVGLADGHLWAGGAAEAKNGIVCNPNMPTEEVFTTPHKMRVSGRARASKPLAYQGTLIDGIEVVFEDGRITEARASRGEQAFLNLLDTDEGARRLGEVALVPHASPISQSGVLFYNTLFDENAACHIALGNCYTECLEDGGALTGDALAARGGNESLVHVDWMIGAKDTEIDGIAADGTRVPVFRGGNWAD
ncbi:aminopeptidase [Alphaproteobacteria bacterium GH1-50]|uniref:Aminopeptidase n=1 Tax=Kangsaoukella pontilimi TaxID=2691042 RepID=A0A7C9MVU5_9RHOB|nr:aminopeptidase [Kangsaoukella pontilimi]MXQ07920.1 aminopeptidase [Kangsaoukella pontilimi]